ncbi:MAG: prepilin-type N-terminal cleavage/methylation domain-containing protein, partial [Pseudomonadota bacterium]
MKRVRRGFSIIELMIALTLGLIVVAGIVQLFVGNSRTYDVIRAQARLQENARFSFEFISDAARNAGYLGCAPEPQFLINGLIGVETQIPEYFVWRTVQGFESQGNGTWIPDTVILPRTEGGTNARVHIAGNGIDRTGLDPNSDLILFRSLEQPVAHLGAFFQPQDLSLVLNTPGGSPGFEVNDVVLVSDCQQAVLLRATQAANAANSTTLTFDRVNTTDPFDNGITFR